MLRIATVYKEILPDYFLKKSMDRICWQKIINGMLRKGHHVDVVCHNGELAFKERASLKCVNPFDVHWHDYDCVITFFHEGYQTLKNFQGDHHPYIMSYLGSVVGRHDYVSGVYFFNTVRQRLYALQKEIALKSRRVTVLTEQSRQLWIKEHGQREKVVIVPTAIEEHICPPQTNPYAGFKEKIAVYVGTVYKKRHQPEINRIWQERLNVLGRALKQKGIRLCRVGPGESELLDPEYVTDFGNVSDEHIQDFHHFADVGVVLAQGPVQHNEASKIYHYLRTGLPVVSEAPIPNNNVILNAQLGFIVPYKNAQLMATRIEEAVHRPWNRERAIQYILNHHTWQQRLDYFEHLLKDSVEESLLEVVG